MFVLSVMRKSMRIPYQRCGRNALLALVQRCGRNALLALGFTGLSVVAGPGVTPAMADLKLCNQTSSRVGVSIGYKDTEGWASEGWWNIASSTCETVLKGVLIGRYYYIHAVDYDRGGEWAGALFMCTDDKSFTIRDTADCEKRGHKRTGFFEVDTGEERDWTVKLTDPEGEEDKTQ